MTPDRVNPENLLFVVQEHQRRLDKIEQHTEDLGVIRRDIDACRKAGEVTVIDVRELRDALDEFRGLLVKTAVGVAGSLLVFSLTLFALFK